MRNLYDQSVSMVAMPRGTHTTEIVFAPHQTQFFAWELTRRANADSVESLGSTLVDAQVDLNPHQVEAALFACRNPLSRGVILADEVGLGKTIEAGLVLAQFWAERKRRVLIIVPANLRKQWHQELKDKFALDGQILESKGYNQQRRDGVANPFDIGAPIICSYQFAKAKIADLRAVPWDIVVFDEAHRLRNVYKPGNVIANTLKDGLAQVPAKVLLTATPLQNSLLELFGLVSVIDERIFGDLDSFRRQFARINQPETFQALRRRIAPLCKRTLRKQVAHSISYTNRIPIVQEFTPGDDEQRLRGLVADYLRRPDLKALPNSQRQLISLVLWKLLASSTHAIGGALGTMATRLERLLAETPEPEGLADRIGRDFEALDETDDEGDGSSDADASLSAQDRAAIAKEISELRRYEQLANGIRDNAKDEALLAALGRAFTELDHLGAPRKALIFNESRAGGALPQPRHGDDRHRGRRRGHQPPVLFSGHQLRSALEPAARRAAHRALPPLRAAVRRGRRQLHRPQQRRRPSRVPALGTEVPALQRRLWR
jgi:hypothetical protein